jgi:hypothetical protein
VEVMPLLCHPVDQNAKNSVGTHFMFQDLKTVFMHLSYGCAFKMGSNNSLEKDDIYRGKGERERERERH